MREKSPTIKILSFFCGLFLFASDRVLKIIATKNIFNGEKYTIIKNILYFDFFKNYNIAFSIPVSNLVAIILSITLLILMIIYFVKLKEVSKRCFGPIILVFIGALSNIIDRIKFGYVIDYLNFININVFNLADVFIVLGILTIIIKNIKWLEKSK